jgi:hypothetical protein
MPKASATASRRHGPAEQPGPSYAEFTDFGRDAIAAAIDTNAALSAGIEKIGQEVVLYARDAFANAGETARGLLGARTFEDVVRLQTEFAKHNFAELVERTTKLSELGCALFGAWTGRAKISP